MADVIIAHVRCYADFVGGGRFLPNAVPHTLDEDAAGLQELLCLERARTETALRSESDLILLDRGVHTLLAHRYAIERTTGLTCFGPAQRAVDKAQLPSRPDLVTYLDVPQEVVHARNHGKFPTDSIFIDARFNSGIRSYFAEITERQPILWLDATLDPGKLVKLAEVEVRRLLARVRAS
ncbi:MAG TPA: hypothetical protein VFC19_42425 [Candidatus Limnocylindrales bacterium]|nr:hypothetical protein [Candidatus Limnocylindrales bacterium]